MTEEDYRELLNSHDWYYEFSDDYRFYDKGRKERAKIKQLALSDEKLGRMYEDKVYEMRVR